PIEQPGRSFSSPFSPLWFIRFHNPCWAATIPLTWAEDRALLRSNLSAVPGANTEGGGIVPPSAIRDWHPSAKAPRLRCSPALARLPPYVHSCFSLSFAPASARARHSA